MISDLRQYLCPRSSPDQPEIFQQKVWQPRSPSPQTGKHQRPHTPHSPHYEAIKVNAKVQEEVHDDNDNFWRSEILNCSDPELRSLMIHQRRAEMRWKNHKKLMSEQV
jgi:hypothetical protein